MKSLKYLRREEKFIESLLDMLDYFVHRLDSGKDVPPYMFKEIMEFLQIYVDGPHTTRQEIILTFLGTYGMDTPTQEFEDIHTSLKKYERFLLRVIEAYDLGYQGAKGVLAYYAKRYTLILRQHFTIEAELLTRWIDNQEQRDGEILKQFKKVDRGAKRIRERGIVKMDALKRESQAVRS